ncbi:MAG: hypothetical protein A2469_04515 [Candidatus Magasanikbacteria bacterium RIFOXYC2_FULL_40_16]|uniref:Uncharacterized protein n=3 Tax=Candidatus Magasanikiibacteriota TaxID=1752731 RepID=A0A1F6NEZ3_9BACT|nr:MAG: hypothetical protein A2224_00230 [Candidatus Magasanikbacteria bacterium RIFOXYA2_FULL_40_20]OGH82303.1 MAG: hypothetical protein A2373_02280 [Candidatus Magasanikbacteria bacterium RIFOXYB1_FULL_40_15]OGH86390.1 MAG: hypothetical protein A2301_00530 [Candidatus Magasanikbacteria bacterium RIFOXYB2_FULL_40_13]OGH87398.1 MAG: hypothetical protein A2206_01690 [Candidatus Magasanikbacteria bacterium RIFOXYA1_FULL_40_8]OGH89432.1 MAG: hypothetical protein A2469_04515 [Candidatus Magasanikba
MKPARIEIISNEAEGFKQALDVGGLFHVFADTGLPAYSQRYKMVEDFSFGRAVVVDDQDNFFHIKPDGSPAYAERYLTVKMFTIVEEDLFLSVVMDNDRNCFHIDRDGRPAYLYRFDYAGDFSSGLAPIRTDEVYYYILPNGEPAHGPRDSFDLAAEFYLDVATVVKNGRQFKILPDGTELGAFGKKH